MTVATPIDLDFNASTPVAPEVAGLSAHRTSRSSDGLTRGERS
jgi:hypothetical protein